MLIKYPRTVHLPWSGCITSDDKLLKSTAHFEGKQVVVSVKMDGEQTTMYRDYVHARSLDSRNHYSRNWVRNLHGQIGYRIPIGWRICGENLYAKHNIHYHNLKSYFVVFSIWNENNVCLSWADTKIWCALLNLQSVSVLYKGVYDEERISTFDILAKNNGDEVEGYVVRLAGAFNYVDFKQSVAKYVKVEFREGLKDQVNWIHQQIIPNDLGGCIEGELCKT